MQRQGFELDRITCCATISACQACGQWVEALALLDEQQQKSLHPEVIAYSAVISACAKGEQWQRAVGLLGAMQLDGVQPEVITYNAVISACEKGGCWDRALDMLSTMQQRGIQANTITYSATISACEKAARWEHALELLQEMEERGVEPSVITYSAAISACEKGEQWEQSLGLLLDMQERAVRPNIVTFNAAISACASGAQWQLALEMMCNLERRGLWPNVITYSAAISSCEKGGQWLQALGLLHDMCSRSLKLSVIPFAAAISACSRAGEWEQAFGLLSEMHSQRVAQNVIACNAAVSACEKGGQWQRALGLLGSMRLRSLTPDVVSFSAAISACEKSGQWAEALELLAEMRQADLEPDLITFDAAVRACEKGELLVRTLRLQLSSQPLQGGLGGRWPWERLRAGPGGGSARVHFCIFQGDEEGLGGWSLEMGSVQNRWDVLLDGLLKCVMMDGEWPSQVCASALVGADAVHLNGDVQRWVMPVVGRHSDGRPMFQPATFKAWEETLWRARGQDLEGLRWHLPHHRPDSREEARTMLLDHLAEVLADAPDEAVVLAFSPDPKCVAYEELKVRGIGRPARAGRVFVLLGGAHGFDGEDDRSPGAQDGSFFEAVLERFAARFGPRRVVRVRLGCGEGASNFGTSELKFTLANVASFVSVEHSRGVLARVIAGIEGLDASGVAVDTLQANR